MSKILHISHAKENSGWGVAARNDLHALAKEHDIVARYISYNAEIKDPLLLSLERKELKDITHVIQYVLPHEFERYPNVRNIGYFEIESINHLYNLWSDSFNMMDELWVVNNEAKEIVGKYTKLPIYVVPHAVDLEVYNKEYPKIDIKQSRSNYHFYTIGENVPRKNLSHLIAAYYGEFDATEPCTLLIKTNNNMSDQIHDLQKRLKLYPRHTDYSQIAVIDGHISAEQIYGIHKLGDCYVNISCGESWCLPLVDAVGFGNHVITIDEGGPADILRGNGSLLPYIYTWCEGHNFFPGFQNALDYWKIVDTRLLRKAMREAYENRPKLDKNLLNIFSESEFCKLIKERTK
jgi:hypothetical protein